MYFLRLTSLLFIQLVVSQTYHGSSIVRINTRIGDRVDLACTFAPRERGSIAWRVNGELIAFGAIKTSTNSRVNVRGHGVIEIYPVEAEDVKTYVCSNEDRSQEQKFELVVNHPDYNPTYHEPAPPPPPPPPPPAPYTLGSDACQLVDRLERKMDSMSQKMDQMSERMHTLETYQSRIEYYVKSMSGHHYTPETKYITHSPIRMTTIRPRIDRGTTPEAKLIYVNNKDVREYTWVIGRFEQEMQKAQNNGDHMLKTYFLTAIPGYNMTLRIYPNRDRLGYIAVYAGLAPGNYDNLMPWPFRMHYEMAIVNQMENSQSVVGTIKPFISSCAEHTFNRRSYDDGVSCGYPKFMDLREFRHKQYNYLKNGNIHFRIRLSDP